jgi:hypothetical protein
LKAKSIRDFGEMDNSTPATPQHVFTWEKPWDRRAEKRESLFSLHQI